MNCKDFLSLQSEYIDGCLSREAAESMRMHLAECPACRRTHAEMKALLETLHTMDDIPVPGGLADEIVAAVLPAKKEKRVFGLPRFLRSWQTYSVVAACMLLVCVLFTQTHDRYLMTSTENTVDMPPAETASPLPEAAFKAMSAAKPSGDAGAAHDAAGAAEDDAAYAYSAAAPPPSAAPAADPVENAVAAPTPESQPTRETAAEAPEEAPVRAFSRMLPETSAAADFAEDAVPEAAEMPAEASVPFMMAETPAYDPANQKSAVTSAADATEEADATNAPTAGAARASGGAASGGAISRITAQPYSLVSSLIQERVTFTVGDPAAEAIFQNTRSRGEAAVEAALEDADIACSITVGVEKDCTAEYNALSKAANALAARIADGETGLETQLSLLEAEMQKLRETCASPALYLSLS